MPEKPQPQAFSRIAEELIGDLRGVPYEVPARQVKRATQPLGGLLESLLDKFQIGRDTPEHVIREHWTAIAGTNATYSHPVQIDPRGQLLVLVSHPVVRQELFANRAMLVERIRALPRCSHVCSLNLRTG